LFFDSLKTQGLVECLPSKHEALISRSSTKKKKKTHDKEVADGVGSSG
jgi:hypothetical protein